MPDTRLREAIALAEEARYWAIRYKEASERVEATAKLVEHLTKQEAVDLDGTATDAIVDKLTEEDDDA